VSLAFQDRLGLVLYRQSCILCTRPLARAYPVGRLYATLSVIQRSLILVAPLRSFEACHSDVFISPNTAGIIARAAEPLWRLILIRLAGGCLVQRPSSVMGAYISGWFPLPGRAALTWRLGA